MTAGPVAPVIPGSGRGRPRPGKPAAGRPVPLASPPGRPEVVYGFGRIDASGRVADRATIAALGWRGGDRLTLTGEAGVMIARRDPGGMVTVPARPYVVIPAALRSRCGLRAGDNVLMAASPGQDTLAAYSFAVVDQAMRAHAAIAGGGGGYEHLVLLREKSETVRWQPVSPTLMGRLVRHGQDRHAPAGGQLLRYADGRPVTSRRYDHLWRRLGRHRPWVRTQQISMHWIRHTTLTWVERNFGYAVARAYAGHTDGGGEAGATSTYVRASLSEVAAALAALTGEPHPLAASEGR